MANTRQLHAFKETDRILLSKLATVAEEAGLREASMGATVVKGEPSLGFRPANLSKQLDQFAEDSILIGEASVSGQLGSNNKHVTVKVTRLPRHDVVEVIGQQVEFEHLAGVMRSTIQHFRTFDRSERVEQALGEELTEFYRQRETALMRLEDVIQNLAERQAEYQQKLNDGTEQLRQQLHDENEAHRAKLNAGDKTRQEEWKKRNNELDDRKKLLDDRAAKHARRDIQKSLESKLGTLDTNFQLTKGTQEKRKGIHIIFVSASLVSLASTLWLLLSEWDATSIPMWVKLGLSSVTFFGFSTAYLGWMNHWFRQHADEELRLKRLSIDIVRASWLVETVSEWQSEHPGEPLPDELLRQVGGGLFEHGDSHEEDEDMLAKLVGAASRLQVNTPTTQFEFDRKSKRKLEEKGE